MYSLFKRLLDVLLSGIGLILLSPVIIFFALLVITESRGGAFFIQKRLGKGGKPFNMYKFRSMIVGAEKQGTGVYSFKGDARITKVGRFIRATSIDELPQLFNIIKGDMSLVGPRPVLTYHPWTIDKYTPEQLRMFEVRPGITGWAQVNGRKEVEWPRRIELNVEYVDRMSFFFDLKILFLTVFKVFTMADNNNKTKTA